MPLTSESFDLIADYIESGGATVLPAFMPEEPQTIDHQGRMYIGTDGHLTEGCYWVQAHSGD